MAKRDKSFKNTWISVKDQSLATAVREAGFDLSVFHEYSEATQDEVRKQSFKYALRSISDDYEEQTGHDLAALEYGVYVIRLSDPFILSYHNENCDDPESIFSNTSQIVYIGRGDVLVRLKHHFQHKLFDFMLSLSGASFDFQILDPGMAKSAHYTVADLHKQIEHDLLVEFSRTVSCADRGFPLLNKNRGSSAGLDYTGGSWKVPLRRKNDKMIEWVITPTPYLRSFNLD